jgi:translation initiation factor IF-1
MPGNDAIELEAAVIAVLPAGRLRARLPNGHELIARIPRRSQERLGLVDVGDSVLVTVSPGDMSQGVVGTILKRIKKHESSRVS